MKWSKAISIGVSKKEDGQYTQAIRYFNKALVTARSNGSKEEETRTLNLLADLYNSIEKYREAVDYYEKGLPIAQGLGDKKLEWTICSGLARANEKLGQYNDGMKYTKQGLDIALRTGDSELIANSYHNLGDAYDSLCEYQNSIKCYNKAINMYKQQGDEKGLGTSYGNLSISYSKQGKYHDAIHFQEESLRICERIGDKKRKANSLLGLGTIHHRLNNPEKATDYYQQSLSLAEEISHKSLQGKSYGNLGNILTKSGNFKDAICYYVEALKIAIQLGDKLGEAIANVNIGICYMNIKVYPEAIKCFNSSLIIAKEIEEKPTEAYVYSNMACLHFVIGEFQQAISMSEKCLNIALSINNKECEGCAYMLLGKAYHSLAKDNQEHETHLSYMFKSEEYLKKALDCHDFLFSQLHHCDQFKISIFDKFMESYKLLSTVYIEKQQPQEALLVSDRERARALGDRLIFKYSICQDEFLSSEPLTYPDVEKVLSNDAFTLLHYSLLNRGLAVWVLSKDSITFKETDKQQFVTAMNQQEDTINRFFTDTVVRAYEDMKIKEGVTCENRSLDDYVTPKDQQHDGLTESLSCAGTSVDEPGQESHPLELLYNAVVAPILSHVKHDEVVIVPDGKMYTVPFAALKDPNTGQYLSETKRIRLAPSITILKVLYDCPVDNHTQQGALIVGNPSVGEVMFRGEKTTFRDLDSAQEEVTGISYFLRQASKRTANPNITKLTRKQATKDVVLTKLNEGAAIIHIAAHGSSEYGEIILSPNVSSGRSGLPEEQDYLLTMTEVQQVGIKAQLVVLSCCYSGLGEIRAEGMVGLSRAFLSAGARAVVASLWAIDDKVTLHFMACFYECLCRGDSASVSLGKAMKDIREQPKYSDPKYWAPFFLIGDDVTIKFEDN